MKGKANPTSPESTTVVSIKNREVVNYGRTSIQSETEEVSVASEGLPPD